MFQEQFQDRDSQSLGEKLLCFLRTGREPERDIVLRCKDSAEKVARKSVLQASMENFDEVFDRDRIELNEIFNVDYTGPVMDTVLEHIYVGQTELKVDQVIALLSAARKFGLRNLANDVKEFMIDHPNRWLDSSDFLQCDTAEDVVLLKEVFSDSRFCGRLLLYQRICDWIHRMSSQGAVNCNVGLLDRDFFEALIDKDILNFFDMFVCRSGEPSGGLRRFTQNGNSV